MDPLVFRLQRALLQFHRLTAHVEHPIHLEERAVVFAQLLVPDVELLVDSISRYEMMEPGDTDE